MPRHARSHTHTSPPSSEPPPATALLRLSMPAPTAQADRQRAPPPLSLPPKLSSQGARGWLIATLTAVQKLSPASHPSRQSAIGEESVTLSILASRGLRTAPPGMTREHLTLKPRSDLWVFLSSLFLPTVSPPDTGVNDLILGQKPTGAWSPPSAPSWMPAGAPPCPGLTPAGPHPSAVTVQATALFCLKPSGNPSALEVAVSCGWQACPPLFPNSRIGTQ